MSKSSRTLLLALSGLTLGVAAAGAISSIPGRAAGFGPAVTGDASLNANLGVLRQVIAWQHAPESDVFQLALATPEQEPFENVALASDPMRGASFAPAVHNDPSLNASEAALTRWIAYRNSPDGETFRPAELEVAVASTNFLRVALASIPEGRIDLSGE